MAVTSQDASLFLSCVQETGRELRRSAYGIDYAVLWHGATCSAKKVNPSLLETPHLKRTVHDGLVKECRTWSRLRHPHVVQFLGLWRSVASPVPLLVTENMDTTLSLLLGAKSREQFPLVEKVSVLQQVASGLAYLHSHSPPIIHGDLSSASVMVDVSSMQAKITNLGIASAVQPALSGSQTLTPNHRVYLPLEVLESKRPTPITTEMDTFAYGVLVIHTLTQTLPIPSSQGTKEKSGPLTKVCELKRRQHFLDLFSEKENRLLLATVTLCLDFQPDRHLNASFLERQMREVLEDCRQAQESASAAKEQGCSLQVEGTQYEHLHTRLSAVDYDIKSKELQIDALLRRVERLEETLCHRTPIKGPVVGTASAVSRRTEDTVCVSSLGNTARFDRNELVHRIWEIEAMSSGETSQKGLEKTEKEIDSACDFVEPKDSINLTPADSENTRHWVCHLK